MCNGEKNDLGIDRSNSGFFRGQFANHQELGSRRDVQRQKDKRRTSAIFTRRNCRQPVIYSRVSSHDQKSDLKRQSEDLLEYCKKKEFGEIEIIEEIGSGMNYRKRGLRKLIAEVINGKIKRIVVNFKDRLMRFGSEILSQLCALKQVEIIEVSEATAKSFEQQLVDDVLMIMTVYSSKIYGKRSHRNRQRKMQVLTC